MANKRTHELTDTQSTYSPDIVVPVDDVTFTNTKKMPIDAIFPKTNTLGAIGNFNPASVLLRTDNGSGSETKVTINNMLSDADVITKITDNIVNTPASVTAIATAVTAQILGTSSAVSFTGTSDSNFTSVAMSGRKLGDVFAIAGVFTVTAASGLKFLKNISGFTASGVVYNFALFNDNEFVTQGGWGYVDGSGAIYVAAGNTGIYRLGVGVISG